jgi:hypothetical protein
MRQKLITSKGASEGLGYIHPLVQHPVKKHSPIKLETLIHTLIYRG